MAPSSPPDNNDFRPPEASGTDASGTDASGTDASDIDASGTDASDIDPSGDANWSQLETLQALAQIVREEKLGELQVRFGTARLKLKASNAKPARAASSSDPPPFAAQTPEFDVLESPHAESRITASPLETSAVDANVVVVISPMVGLFYRAPSPNDPVFVSVGDRVEIGQTLGLIETMKVFNEITSEVEGTVAAIAFENGQLIETGDAIMTIRRA